MGEGCTVDRYEDLSGQSASVALRRGGGTRFCARGIAPSDPYRDWPAIDNIVQATSGMMMLDRAEGDSRMRIGFPIVDTLTGQTAVMAILAALLRREREGTGFFIDVRRMPGRPS